MSRSGIHPNYQTWAALHAAMLNFLGEAKRAAAIPGAPEQIRASDAAPIVCMVDDALNVENTCWWFIRWLHAGPPGRAGDNIQWAS